MKKLITLALIVASSFSFATEAYTCKQLVVEMETNTINEEALKAEAGESVEILLEKYGLSKTSAIVEAIDTYSEEAFGNAVYEICKKGEFKQARFPIAMAFVEAYQGKLGDQ